MVRLMSEPSQDDPKPPADAAAKPTPTANDSGGVIPVEVEAPSADGAPAEVAAPDPVAELEKKLAATEKEKKENWDKYLRAVS
jgi:hypothetical protein